MNFFTALIVEGNNRSSLVLDRFRNSEEFVSRLFSGAALTGREGASQVEVLGFFTVFG